MFREEWMLKGWGSTDPSLLPKVKGSPGSPTAPAPAPPGLLCTRSARKRGECSYLCKQQHGSSLCLYSFYKSQQETVCSGGWQPEQGGSPAPAGHRPHYPRPWHTAIYCSGVD